MGGESGCVRVLVAGLGSIGQRHARLLAERLDVSVSLCDPIAEHRAQAAAAMARPPAANFDSYEAALSRARPELVFICTPNHLHVPMGLAALDAGADLMVEKPIADGVAQARQLVCRAQAAGRFLHVGYMLRFDPGLERMRTVAAQGRIGSIVAARAMIGTYVTLLNARSPDRVKQPYSLLVDYTHEFDYIGWILGPARAVAALEARLGAIDIKPLQNIIAVTLALASGAVAQVHMDYVQFPQRRTFELIGDHGTLAYDFMTGELRHYPYGREHRFDVEHLRPLSDRVDDLYRQQLVDILMRRRQGRPALVGGADGLAALQVAEAAMRACRSGHVEPVDRPGPDETADQAIAGDGRHA